MRTIYIGMDIHKKFIQAAALDEKGSRIAEQKFDNNSKEIKRFMKKFRKHNVKTAIEATCIWYHVYEALEDLGIETTLVNVRRTKVIAESKIKTDKLDALAIAQCLRTGFIATAYVPPKRIRELRNVVRHRVSLKKEITRNKNRIQSILLRNGVKHPFSDLFGKKGRKFLESTDLKESEKLRLDSYLAILDSLEKEKRNITERIEELCKADKKAMLLTTIPGISYYSALLMTSEIGEIERFRNPKKLCSYAGLVPKVMQSGYKEFHGRTIKECNQNLKWILNQCTHIHIRNCRSRITKMYYRIAKKDTNKATIAASRKMLVAIWAMLSRDEPFKG